MFLANSGGQIATLPGIGSAGKGTGFFQDANAQPISLGSPILQGVFDQATGRELVVSGNGGKGLYPWIDLPSRTWGVVGVQDDRGAEVAVPASQAVEVAARAVVDE